MEEKELKTSPKQRVFIIIIAVIMLGSIIASYAGIILAGGGSSASPSRSAEEQATITDEKKAEYQAAYDKVVEKFKEQTKSDFDRFVKYRSEITAFNETTANAEKLKTRDLREGSGRTLEEGDTNYLAYYVGWCPDDSVFDSSFDDNDNPTAFTRILDPSIGVIEGWNSGVVGMKLDGIREITIAGELAYGDSMEICGGKNKPLKFIIMAKEKTAELQALSDELEVAHMRNQYAQYGIDYDEMMKNQSTESTEESTESTPESAE